MTNEEKIICKQFLNDADKTHSCNEYKLLMNLIEQEPTAENCESCKYFGSHHGVCNYCYKCSLWTEIEPTTKNNLGVNCIDRMKLLKAMDTWDKFGNDPNEGLIPLRTPTLQDRYVPYVKYDDVINCVKDMSPVTPIRPKGHWFLTDVEGNKVWHCHCSECGKDPQNYVGGSENWWLIKSKLPEFCPSCGSDNREVVEE